MPSVLKRALDSSDEVSGDEISLKSNDRKRSRLPSEHDQQPVEDEETQDSEDDLVDDEDDNELELNDGQTQQSTLHTNGSGLPDVSESGTIAKIEVVNFMCHKYLKMDFGPKINFVIGHNGSGKSAILTALIVALGAKATSTNRGKNLSSLIREGANAALVTIHITNKGPDAYKPDIYGDCIIVDRRLLRDGMNSFKIKDHRGKVVSVKREELTAICDHMSIQVDNPLTMLSQDSARQFLNSSSPSDKYKLFMRGTQLAQIENDFNKIRETLEITDETIKRKMEHLPVLHQKAKEAEVRYKELMANNDLDLQIDDLNNELVWSQIIRKETELVKAKQVVAVSQGHLDESNRQIQGAHDKIERFNEEIAALRQQAHDYQQKYAPDDEAKRLLNAKLLAAQQKCDEIKRDISDTNAQFKQYNGQLKLCNNEISVAKAKLESNNREMIEGINNRIKQSEIKKEELLATSRDLATQRSDIEKTIEDENANIVSSNQTGRELVKSYKDLEVTKQRLQAQKENKLKAFGQRMPEALVAIANERRWTGQPPVGPFGQYMNLKHPEFAEVMEISLGKSLSNFAVENFQDQALLRHILARHDLGRCNIMVAKKDLFDYSDNEPDASLLTILRAIDFEDEYVKRQLVISNNIHQIILMQERTQAEDLMNGHPRNVKLCFTRDCQTVGAKTGMRTESLKRHKGPIRFKKDVDGDIREADNEMKELGAKIQEKKEAVRTSEAKIRSLRAELGRIQGTLRETETRLRRIVHEIETLQESLKESEPVNLSFLEEERNECENKTKQLIGVFKSLKADSQVFQQELADVEQEIQAVDEADDKHSRHLQQYRDEIHKLESLIHSQKAKLVDYESTRQNRHVRYSQNVEQREQIENTISEWTNQAMEDYPTRVDSNRTPEEIQRRIEHLEKKLEEQEKAAGMTIEEAEKEAKRTIIEYTDVKDTITSMEVFLKKMNDSLIKRMDRWNSFLMYIPLSAKGYFTYYMHKRGDNGSLKFNHKKQTLDVRVTTGDQFKEGTARRKDSKSLSGGEKSFSQISLLLSLWHGISSPIFCLDEFDVYMDAVNRKQSMKMMMEAAYETTSQYILITPQDASNMVPGPNVTVHRMADPERRK
ncbi:hypothetical protein [Absidia glauca]|uniref:RecF/RecN/SMC N-terminal domain-containing protein n=1 Tax=Absidia glauca TaxID=4829 RepID=A0A163J9J3_ABSGL|nr:hypothetical protein [Absidia glauca]